MASFTINDVELHRRDDNVKVRRPGKKPQLMTRFMDTEGFSDALIDAMIDRTMDGASSITLEVLDPSGAVANLEDFQTQDLLHPTEVRVGGHWFALAGLSKGGDNMLSITFEDREVNAMRRYRKPRKAKRARVTRAEFCKSLVGEATIVTGRKGASGKIGFVSPESSMRQTIGIEGMTASEALTAETGFPAGIRLKYNRRTFTKTIKSGVKWKNETRIANKTQLNYYDKVFKECHKQKAPKVVYRAAALLALSGSNLWNTNDQPGKPPGNLFGLPRRGKWKVSAGTDAPLTLKRLIPVVVKDLRARAAKNPRATPSMLVAGISGRTGSITKWWLPGALAAVSQWKAGANRTTDAYEFTRGEPAGGKGEDTWSAITRMAGEVAWRCWCSEGVVYFVSEDYLISRPSIITLHKGLDGVLSIDWSQVGGVIDAECTVSILSEAFSIDPGVTVAISGEGKADGKWLVKSVSQSLFSIEASVTLTRAQPRLAEPKADIGELATPGGPTPATNNTVGPVPDRIKAMIRRANEIDGCGYSQQQRNGPTYDCSSAVCHILKAGGFTNTIGSTLYLNNWEQLGTGKYFTVYSGGGGGNSGHCWIVFEKASYAGKGSKPVARQFEVGGRGSRNGWRTYIARSGNQGQTARNVRGW